MRSIVIWLILFCPFTKVFSQEQYADPIVWIKGVVLDEQTHRPIGNIQLASYKKQHLYVANEKGEFSNNFDINDSIKIFGLGFESKTLKVRDCIGSDSTIEVVLSRKTYLIRSVDVAPQRELALHLPSDIKLGEKNKTPPAQRNDDFSSKPPVYVAVLNPLAFAHYYTSKSEKRKRAYRKEMINYDKQLKIDQFYNRDIIKEISGLDGENLDRFIVYCNVHLKIDENRNAIIVKQWIKELYVEYKERIK